MGWQERIAKEFNRSFNEPFMPEGFCKAEVKKTSDGKILYIQLGDRDVEFDAWGNCLGSSSNVNEGIHWDIKELTGK